MSYSVKTVANMTGIPRPTLLAWERRYEILAPGRSGGGYRIYSDADVGVLRRLKALVDAGHPIGEAVRIAKQVDAPLVSAQAPLRERVMEALRFFDRSALDRMGPELAQFAFSKAIDEVYMPVLSQVGDEWAAGTMSVAQEHFASNWCGEQMLAIFHALGAGPEAGPSVVCAMAPGDEHHLGLLAVAIKLALDGWRVTWLGANLPIDELVLATRVAKPRLVCLSVVVRHTPAQVLSYAGHLRRAVPPGTVVAVGGPLAAGFEEHSGDGIVFAPTFSGLRKTLDRIASRT